MKKERDWKKVKDECSVVEGGGGEIHEKERHGTRRRGGRRRGKDMEW